MATYYVTSADVGAPALTGQNGSLCTVMDYILNTVAGLTIHFTATNIRIYTMPDAAATQLRFCHDSAVSGDARFCIVRQAESASAHSTLVDPSPTVALIADTSANWVLSATANATARSWWALVDTTNPCLIFLVDTDNAAGTVAGFIRGGGFWFGAQSQLASDNYAGLVFVRNTTSTSTGVTATCPFMQFFRPDSGQSQLAWKRSRDGTIKSVRGFLGPVLHASAMPGVGGGPAYPHPDDTKMRKCKVYAGDNYSQSGTPGAAVEPLRMWLPHVWMGMHLTSNYSSINIGDLVSDTAYDAVNGGTSQFAFFPFLSAVGVNGAILLEITNTWHQPVI